MIKLSDRKRSKALATGYSQYGYLMLHGLLKSEGLVQNKKQTYRIYTEEGVQVRTKKRKKIQRPRVPMEVTTKPNQRWSMDFVSDQLANGRRFSTLNVVDDYLREVVGQAVAVSISGRQVACFLSHLAETGRQPHSIVCDNGTEFSSKAMFFWSKETNIRVSFIQPGKSTQNAFVESFNGKFRNECLNQHWFRAMEEAKYESDKWSEHCYHLRPLSSLNYLSPVEFAKQTA